MKYFINFFEIGRFDRGLFRVWIVLTFIYCIFSIFLLKDSQQYRDYSRIKNFNSETAKTTYCKKQSRYFAFDDFVKTEWYGLSEWMKPMDNNSMNIGISKTFNECFIKYSDLKIKFYNNYIIFILFLVLIPFVVGFTYLLIKKILLWIYRGFK